MPTFYKNARLTPYNFLKTDIHKIWNKKLFRAKFDKKTRLTLYDFNKKLISIGFKKNSFSANILQKCKANFLKTDIHKIKKKLLSANSLQKCKAYPLQLFKNWYPQDFCKKINTLPKLTKMQFKKNLCYKIKHFYKTNARLTPYNFLKTDIHKIFVKKNSFSANILQKCKAYPLQLFKNWYP